MRLRTSPHLKPETVARSRALRKAMTEAERRLWYALREHFSETKFRIQVPFGPYHADFASHRARLIVEVDGSQHAIERERDLVRTRFLSGEGYRVLRFWNNEVLGNLDGVLAVIASHIPSPPVGEGGPQGRMRGARRSRAPALRAGTPHPKPSPTRGEGEKSSKPFRSCEGEVGERGARRSRAPASGRHPSPPGLSPTRGEGSVGQPSVGVS